MKFFSIRHASSIFLLSCFLAPVCSIQAQTLSQSPYGRFGLGDHIGNSSAYIQGIGGSTQAVSDSNSLNLSQPAALASLEGGVTILEFGFSGLTSKYQGLQNTKMGRTAGFGYFGLAFPIKKNKWNLSLSLTPITNAGYTLRDSILDDEVGKINLNYKGQGGFSAFTIGNGFHFGKNLNLGVQLHYLFGRTDYSSEVLYSGDTITQRNSLVTSSNRLNDVDLVFGAQYLIRFHKIKSTVKAVSDTSHTANRKSRLRNDSLHVVLGGTFRPATFINGSTSYLAQTFFGNAPGTSYTDTVLFKDQVKGTVAMPMQVGGGITFGSSSRSWMLTTEYIHTDWNGFRLFDRVDSVRTSYRVGMGLEINPTPINRTTSAKTAYWKKIRYRLGGYYSDGYLRINGQAIPEFGVSLGFGLPITIRTYNTRTATSILNFAVTAGQRGVSGTNSLQEQFIRGTVSFSLNDRWFRKFQYD
jgi:hypothetical protein